VKGHHGIEQVQLILIVHVLNSGLTDREGDHIFITQ
jgi:hypothetical protein